MSHFHKFTVADKFKIHTLVSVYYLFFSFGLVYEIVQCYTYANRGYVKTMDFV